MKKYCVLWPLCSCGWSWRRWQLVAEDSGWQPDELQLNYSEMEIRNVLDCVSRRCPDPEFRRHAMVQLMQLTNGGCHGC
jgi:hypothetical protein